MIVQVIQDQLLISINIESVEKLVIDFTSFHQVRFDEATIHFVTTPTICELHQQFFDDPSTTDCISFPMDDSKEEGYRVLGDVFVCPETAVDYIKVHGGNVYHELTLYVIHGLLHILGYDDIDENDRLAMREEEKRYLDHVEAEALWIKS